MKEIMRQSLFSDSLRPVREHWIRLKEWKPAFAYKPTYAFLLEKMLAKTNDIGICGQKKHHL